MYKSKTPGERGTYYITGGWTFAIILIIILLTGTVAMLITILAVGVNTVKSVDSKMVSGIITPAISGVMNDAGLEERIIELIRSAIQKVVEENDLLSTLADFILSDKSGDNFPSFDPSKLPKLPDGLDDLDEYSDGKKRNTECSKISDQGMCRQAKNVCGLYAECLRTYNETICTHAARSVGMFCLRV